MSQAHGMGRAEWLSVAAVVIAVVAGLATAIAGSQGGQLVAGVPVFAVCVALAFVIQWVVFVPSYRRQHIETNERALRAGWDAATPGAAPVWEDAA